MPSLVINTNADLGDADTKKALMTKLTQVQSCAMDDAGGLCLHVHVRARARPQASH
jgi:hypothetical protein